MPFTLAHAAAARPFRRTSIAMPALIIGTFAPDLTYFLFLGPRGRFSHSLVGIFCLTLPLGLAVLWLFESVVKTPLIELLPGAIRRRLNRPASEPGQPRLVGLAGVVAAMLLGIATHILWDSFTHWNTWITRRWTFLNRKVHLSAVGTIPYFKVLQHVSTIVGVLVVVLWFVHWYRTTQPAAESSEPELSGGRRAVIVAVGVLLALVGAIVRALHAAAIPYQIRGSARFAGDAVCAFVALVWWELVVYGLVQRRSMKATEALD